MKLYPYTGRSAYPYELVRGGLRAGFVEVRVGRRYVGVCW